MYILYLPGILKNWRQLRYPSYRKWVHMEKKLYTVFNKTELVVYYFIQFHTIFLHSNGLTCTPPRAWSWTRNPCVTVTHCRPRQSPAVSWTSGKSSREKPTKSKLPRVTPECYVNCNVCRELKNTVSHFLVILYGAY